MMGFLKKFLDQKSGKKESGDKREIRSIMKEEY